MVSNRFDPDWPYLTLGLGPLENHTEKEFTFLYLFDQVMILFYFFSIYKCDVRIKHDQIDEMIPSKSWDESPNPTIWLYRPMISSLVSICSGVCFTVTNSSICSKSQSKSLDRGADNFLIAYTVIVTVLYCSTVRVRQTMP